MHPLGHLLTFFQAQIIAYSRQIGQKPANRDCPPDAQKSRCGGCQGVCQDYPCAQRNDGKNDRYPCPADTAVKAVQQKENADAAIKRAFNPEILNTDGDDFRLGGADENFHQRLGE